jgi:hypothetical protein
MDGLEPSCLAAHAPQACVSTETVEGLPSERHLGQGGATVTIRPEAGPKRAGGADSGPLGSEENTDEIFGILLAQIFGGRVVANADSRYLR